MRTLGFALGLVSLLSSCTAAPRVVELSVDVTEPVALSVVRVSADGVSWSSEAYEGTLGTTPVRLLRASPSTLTLLVPDQATGGELVVTQGEVTYRTPPLRVQPLMELTVAPETVVEGRIDAQLELLGREAAAASPELRAGYVRAQDELRAARQRFLALSAEEQQLCAQLVATATARSRFNALGVYRELDREWKAFAWGVALIAVGIYAGPVLGAGAVVTAGVKVAAIVAGVTLTAPAMPRIGSLLNRLYTEPLAEFTPERLSVQDPLLSSITFVQGVPKTLPLRLSMRTLARSDLGSVGAMGDLARLVAEIERDWPAGTSEFPVGPRPPVFREPALVEDRTLDPSSLEAGLVVQGAGLVRLVAQESTPRGLSLTFDDGLSFSAGPRTPIEFSFTLNLRDTGQQLLIPATLQGRHGTVLTIDTADGAPAFVKYDFASGERTVIQGAGEVAQGAYFMTAWDPAERRMYVALPGNMSTRIVGYAIDGIDTTATLNRNIAGLHVRRDGRLLVLYNPGDGSIRLAEVDPLSGIDLELATLVPPASGMEGGGVPTAGHVYDRRSDRFYIVTQRFSGPSVTSSLLVVNATTGDLVRSFPTTNPINFLFATNDGLRVFSANGVGATIESFDTETGARSVVATTPATSFFTDYRSYDPVTNQLFIARDIRADGAMLPKIQIIGVDPSSGSFGTSVTLRDGVNIFCGIEIVR